LFSFEGNKTYLAPATTFYKVVIVGESSNAGIWGRIPQSPEANKSSRAELPTLRRLTQFFPKNSHIYVAFTHAGLTTRYRK